MEKNMAVHLKGRRGAKRPSPTSPGALASQHVYLTPEGYSQLKGRGEWLRAEMARTAEEIRKAREDKDVRENAPLEAARESQGYLAAKLREIEETLRVAELVQNGFAAPAQKLVKPGCRVTVVEVASQKRSTYLLVDPREADPLSGKISIASPVGQALLEKQEGNEIQVTTPRGPVQLRVLKVEPP
jgi:transcription elongation factor GreA